MIEMEQVNDIHVGNGVEDEGMRIMASVQLLSYLYREPDPILSIKNPMFCFWAETLGLNPAALSEAMKESPERLKPYRVSLNG